MSATVTLHDGERLWRAALDEVGLDATDARLTALLHNLRKTPLLSHVQDVSMKELAMHAAKSKAGTMAALGKELVSDPSACSNPTQTVQKVLEAVGLPSFGNALGPIPLEPLAKLTSVRAFVPLFVYTAIFVVTTLAGNVTNIFDVQPLCSVNAMNSEQLEYETQQWFVGRKCYGNCNLDYRTPVNSTMPSGRVSPGNLTSCYFVEGPPAPRLLSPTTSPCMRTYLLNVMGGYQVMGIVAAVCMGLAGSLFAVVAATRASTRCELPCSSRQSKSQQWTAGTMLFVGTLLLVVAILAKYILAAFSPTAVVSWISTDCPQLPTVAPTNVQNPSFFLGTIFATALQLAKEVILTACAAGGIVEWIKNRTTAGRRAASQRHLHRIRSGPEGMSPVTNPADVQVLQNPMAHRPMQPDPSAPTAESLSAPDVHP